MSAAGEPIPGVTLQLVREVVAAHYGVTIAQMVGPNTKREQSLPRHVAFMLCRILCPTASWPAIGRMFGDRDHSTIISGVHRVKLSFEGPDGATLRSDVAKIRQTLVVRARELEERKARSRPPDPDVKIVQLCWEPGHGFLAVGEDGRVYRKNYEVGDLHRSWVLDTPFDEIRLPRKP